MKVLVKSVAQKDKPMEVIIDDDATVGQLVESLLKDHSYKATKLVFKGKVLNESEQKLSDAGVVDGEYCVVIGAKATGAAATASKAVEEKKKEEEKKETDKKEEDKKEATSSSASASAVAQPSEASAAAAGALVSGDELDETIAMIMGMNPDWTKELVSRALTAAFNNPDRAVEFLLTGSIPSHDVPSRPAAAAPAAQQQATSESAAPTANYVIPGVGTLSAQQMAQILAIINQRPGQPAPDPQALTAFLSELARASQHFQGGSSGGSQSGQQEGGELSLLAQRLSQIEEFDQIRRLVAQDSSQLSRVLGTMRLQDPELFQLVNQNQQEFLRLLREGIPGRTSGSPGARTITMTEADDQAIARLTDLGFSSQEATQAYIAADKNEELAANLLFDSNAGMDQD